MSLVSHVGSVMIAPPSIPKTASSANFAYLLRLSLGPGDNLTHDFESAFLALMSEECYHIGTAHNVNDVPLLDNRIFFTT